MKEKICKIFKKICNVVIDNKRWIIILGCVLIFFSVIDDALKEDMSRLDTKGYEIVSMPMSDQLTVVAKIITNVANPVVLLLVAGFLFIILKDKLDKYSVVCNLPISIILNFAIKNVIQRPRPVGHRLIDESGYSFPSGHSMVSMAFYGYLIYIIIKNVKNKYIRIASSIGLFILIILIGLSRIYLGVHYTSDVIGGFVVALSYLMIYTGIIKKWGRGKKLKLTVILAT